MSRVRASQLASEIVEEDQVVLLYKETARLQRVVLPGVPASDLDPEMIGALAEMLSTAMQQPEDKLSGGELEALEGYPTGSRTDVLRSLARTAQARQRTLEESLSAAEAAERLGVGTSRIRQRIGARTLYAVKSGKSWRLPAWQFADQGAWPGMAAVIQVLPDEIDLVEVEGFFTNPSVDLVIDDIAVTPLEWLGAGRDPEPVARIASGL